MSFLPIPKNARDVGVCIYCGATGDSLSTEHAVPYGLNGPWTLLRASCKRCADITHRFERDTLKGLFPAIRNILSMQSRHSRNRSTTLPLLVESNGIQTEIQVPTSEFPLYLLIPVFPPPGVVSGRAPSPCMSVKLEFLHIAGPTFKVFKQRYNANADAVWAHLNFSPELFAQTLAKIAFCAGIYTLGLEPFTNTPIRRVILGQERCLGHWVGSWTGEPMNEAKGGHAMQIRACGSDIHVILRLFAQFGTPEYHVVLGKADPAFVNSNAWPWK